MRNRLSVFLIVAAMAGLSGCETLPRYGEVRVVFSDRDRMIIRDYYRGLPPGLAKQGKIPPGHAFRMQRHQGVPPGVTWETLPADVERRLSRLPDGDVRIVIGTEVAILHTRTRVVLDVIETLPD